MKDGGPAFPRTSAYCDLPGMSLRDYFAAAALAGLCVGPCSSGTDLFAAAAYEAADAMLAHRDSQKPSPLPEPGTLKPEKTLGAK